jgi:3-deoxy-7-phosphoheptulonate synthase
MIILMEPSATEGQIADVVERLAATGASVQRLDGERVTLAITGAVSAAANTAAPGAAAGEQAGAAAADGAGGAGTMAGVAAVIADPGGNPMVEAGAVVGNGNATSGDAEPAAAPAAPGRGFQVRDRWIGGTELFIAAGPCSVEDPATMDRIAAEVAAAGGSALRAGAYKPRSSPYSFQGMGEAGLATARAAADAHGLLLVSEVLDAAQIPIAARYVDILQVGARNMYNTSLLRELGRSRRPVLLKRGLAATIDEWLSAAEYIVSAGNPRVILCERGIRTFETATRNTLDLNAIPVVRERTRLPILVDPSHGTGHRAYVRPMARAAIACGADGLLIEVHTHPDHAVSDAAQTIDPRTFRQVVQDAARLRRQDADDGEDSENVSVARSHEGTKGG